MPRQIEITRRPAPGYDTISGQSQFNPMRLQNFATLSCFILVTAGAISAQQPDTSPDRIVAERVLRLGGAVIPEGQRKPITDLHQLPETEFRIHTLDLVGVSMGAWGLRDEVLRWPALPHLKELYLNGRLWYGQPNTLVADTIALFNGSTALEKFVLSKPVQTYIPIEDTVVKRLTFPGLEEMRLHQTRLPGDSLAPFTQLKHLDLSHNIFFDDRGLRHAAKMPALTKLYLEDTSVTDQGLKNLSGLVQLTELDLDGTKTSDSGLASLAGLTNLRRLDLVGTNVTDGGVEYLMRMTQLERLTLYRTRISNAGLAQLASLKNLKDLDVRYTRVTASGIKDLQAKLPGLTVLFDDSSSGASKRAVEVGSVAGKGEASIGKWLSSLGGTVRMRDGHAVAVGLSSTSITDRELAILRELPLLEELSLRDTEVGDLGATHLATLRALKKLDLSFTSVSDSALGHLKPLTGLQSLDLSHTLVEGPGLAALASMKDLRELNLASARIGDSAMTHLRALVGLEKLSLSYTDVTDPGLEPVSGLANLIELDLAGADVRDAGLAHISGLTKLEDVNLSFTRFTDAGLAHLVALKQLKRLNLQNTIATNKGMASIGALANLEWLNLGYTTVGDEGLASLAGLTKLTDLLLDTVDLTDAGIAHVSALRNLRQLDLYHTLVTDKGFQQLKQALPECVIHYSRDSARRRG
jgi:Leucine-rich repeat (LRR) protein